jgi:hypothetical protein
MGGGLLQIVALGSQDQWLTAMPEITYFASKFKRHSNFAIEPIQQTVQGTIAFGSKLVSIVSRNGDLLGDTWFEITMTRGDDGVAAPNTGPAETYYPAEALFRDITLEIGGSKIDSLKSGYYRFYDNFYRTTNTEREAYKAMTDFVDNESAGTTKRFYVPVLFWYTRSPAHYIPLLSLQYHELRLVVELASAVKGIDTTKGLGLELWCDYVYLDVEERKRISSRPYESLIEQVSYVGDEGVTIDTASQKTQQIRLSFNHPTKMLMFSINHPTTYGLVTGDKEGDTAEILAPLASCRLLLNGHERAAPRHGAYFNKVVPYQSNKAKPDAGYYQISFGISPCAAPPSGQLNFSRVDSAVLALTFKAASKATKALVTNTDTETVDGCKHLSQFRIMSVNLNLLRIVSGMGGLAYSN